MAIRIKTIEYAWPLSTATVSSGAARNFGALTINIPEVTTRTFKSVTLEFSTRDNVGTASGSVTPVVMTCQIGAIATSTSNVAQSLALSGENMSFIFTQEVTAYFNTNFTGTSHTVTPTLTLTSASTSLQNSTCKIIITYAYDDAAQTTRIKTVRIPIDGNTGNLTTTAANLGGVANQIPALDTFLPEASKVYRNIFFQWDVHTGTTAAANSILSIVYGATTVADASNTNGLASDIFVRRIDSLLGVINTAAPQALQAFTSSTTGAPYSCLNGYLTVTYEYDHAASTRIINSIVKPVMDEVGYAGGTTTADMSYFTGTVNIQEPGVIDLVQSGVYTTYSGSGALALTIFAGSASGGVYTHPATVRCGAVSSMLRVDAGGILGQGLTLARGSNSYDLGWYTSSTVTGTVPSNVSGLLFLNYISDKHPDGDGVHLHTTHWNVVPYSTGFLGTSAQKVIKTPTITPELGTSYYIDGIGFNIIYFCAGTPTTNFAVAVLAETMAGDGSTESAGWHPMYSSIVESDAETGPFLSFGRAGDAFRRWPDDPDMDRMNILIPRSYRFDTALTPTASLGYVYQMSSIITYHSIQYAIAGAVSGSAGGTVTVTAHRKSDGVKIGTATTVGDGAYSIPWYDNTSEVFTEAFEDATHIGRSADGFAA